MWYSPRKSPRADLDFIRSATELPRARIRNLMLATGGIYTGWHPAGTLTWRAWLAANAAALLRGLSLGLLKNHLAPAHAI